MRASFHSLGCRVNSYESEAMADRLRAAGYEIVPFGEACDVCVINTCTVTNIADRKSRQMLHRAKEISPGAVVVAAGCYAEDAGEALAKDPLVDLIVGNEEKLNLAAVLEKYFASRGAAAAGSSAAAGSCKDEQEEAPASAAHGAAAGLDAPGEDSLLGAPVSRGGAHTRAFVKVQDGCNQFCSYCVIPYVRGRVRSRDEEDVIDEVRRLAAAGKKEVVLTGIHLSSYGLDLDHPGENRRTPDASAEETNARLLSLVRRAAAVSGVLRLRFGSLEPGIMSGEFVSALSEIPEVCPSFHLSLQSGCDRTLAAMNRRYTTADYLRICERLRASFGNPAITTDVIAGFPGETEEDFDASCAFIERAKLSGIHVFPYSPRKGTRAAGMPGRVGAEEKRARCARLREIARRQREAYAASLTGREVSVLIEEEKLWRGNPMMTGHTREMADAVCLPPPGGEDLRLIPGEIVRCRALRADGDVVIAEAILSETT